MKARFSHGQHSGGKMTILHVPGAHGPGQYESGDDEPPPPPLPRIARVSTKISEWRVMFLTGSYSLPLPSLSSDPTSAADAGCSLANQRYA